MDVESTSSGIHEPGPISKSRPLECAICHRPANGHHCGVASCKACKTFFRRVLVLSMEYQCKFDNSCFDSLDIAKIRIRCQSCRYRKCIKVGMDPTTLELTETEKEAANFKRLVEKSEEEAPSLKVVCLKEKLLTAQKIIDMLVYLDLKIEKFRMSEYNPSFWDFGSLEDMIRREGQICIAGRFENMPGWPVPRNEVSYRPPPTISKIRYVPDANPLRYHHRVKVWMFFNLLTSIEYAKTFPFFYQLAMSDKQILLGHTLLILVNLHNSYFSYSRKLDGCFQPDGSERPFRDEANYKSFLLSLPCLIRFQIHQTEYLLLKALCLCNPNIQGLSTHAQQILTKERQILSNILLEYCLQNSDPGRYSELLGIFSILEIQQKRQKDEYALFVAPLLAKRKIEYTFFEDIMKAE